MDPQFPDIITRSQVVRATSQDLAARAAELHCRARAICADAQAQLDRSRQLRWRGRPNQRRAHDHR